jgi:hypothetical protein
MVLQRRWRPQRLRKLKALVQEKVRDLVVVVGRRRVVALLEVLQV